MFSVLFTSGRRRMAFLLATFLPVATPLLAQNIYNVVDEASWIAAVNGVNSTPTENNIINFQSSLPLFSQQIINANVTINGNSQTAQMGLYDRFLFIVGGNVSINDLYIVDGSVAGGSGDTGSGAGAGLGGALLIGGGTYASGNGTAPYVGISVPNVTLTNVAFQDNSATGGITFMSESLLGGGGGGMGGQGGAASNSNAAGGGGGGGGFGVFSADSQTNAFGGSDGGNGSDGLLVLPGFSSFGGAGGSGNVSDGGEGGANGGGGGSGGNGSNVVGGGGGGGLNGGRGYFQNDDYPNGGGDGGFGGGGGGSTAYYGGAGGFGGGGGSGELIGGNGGFGGGGGSGGALTGTGGFGASNGSLGATAGGGGLGAGGAIFVMGGASLTIIDTGNAWFSGNTVASGSATSGGNVGSAYGADIFLGGNVTLSVAAGQSLTLNSLGGAGNTSDANVAGHEDDVNTQGGITLNGGGQLVLTGSSYYVGASVLQSGTLQFAASALEKGTTSVVVGQSFENEATLSFASSANLTMSGENQDIILGQQAGAYGTVVIGSDGGNGAYLGVASITTGIGSGTLVFNQSMSAAGDSEVYEFYPTITGNVAIIQSGSGITVLDAPNTYSAGTTITAGTLQVNDGATGLGSGTVQVVSGTLSVLGSPATNEVILGEEGTYQVAVGEDANYAGVANAHSAVGGAPVTAASVLSGTASNSTTLTTGFSANSDALNDEIRLSAVYSFVGSGTDAFVLQLTIDSVNSTDFLGWRDGDTWVNATEGNSNNMASGLQLGFQGSFATFQLDYGDDLLEYMGAYGVDVTAGTAWAVLNHNSDFATVPEPSTCALLGLAALVFARMVWRRRKASC